MWYWLSMQGMLTSLLGNLSLLSYFAKKREKEAMLVQTLGVLSTYVVILQLALAQSMPFPYFLATSLVVVFGLFLNFINYFGLLNAQIWRFWEDFITIGGLSVLPQVIILFSSFHLTINTNIPFYLSISTHSFIRFIISIHAYPFAQFIIWIQIMWSTFVPYLPNSILPGALSFLIAVLAVTMVIFLLPYRILFHYFSKT